MGQFRTLRLSKGLWLIVYGPVILFMDSDNFDFSGTGEVGIEDDWDLWFDGHNVAENMWQLN